MRAYRASDARVSRNGVKFGLTFGCLRLATRVNHSVGLHCDRLRLRCTIVTNGKGTAIVVTTAEPIRKRIASAAVTPIATKGAAVGLLLFRYHLMFV